jgi:hypothetical protein
MDKGNNVFGMSIDIDAPVTAKGRIILLNGKLTVQFG